MYRYAATGDLGRKPRPPALAAGALNPESGIDSFDAYGDVRVPITPVYEP